LKLKIDENLPNGCAGILRGEGFEADTVTDERLTGAEDSAIALKAQGEGRVLITLDLDFANIRAYPPAEYAGIIVVRSKSQDKRSVVALMHRIALALTNRTPVGELWIVEPDRIRFRAG
jgi:predicted nuclease of predicted toxin-antitoxin system